MKNFLKGTILVSSMALALSACDVNTDSSNNQTASIQSNGTTVQTGNAGQTKSTVYTSFLKVDVPMPSDSQLDLDHTLIIGDSRNWIGRLSLDAPFKMSKMFDFYQKNMTSFGWKLLSTMRAESSTLTYQYDKRIATIILSPSSLGSNTKVQFTISPENKIVNSFH